jgi:NADH-quinone oxidoreductase subunit H
LIFLICVLSETNRTPFDLAEMWKRINGGYHTEYSLWKCFIWICKYVYLFYYSCILWRYNYGMVARKLGLNLLT